MPDYSSEFPIRSQLPGQSLPDDVIIKIGDGTNPTTQFAAVDTHGSLSSILKDASGNAIGDQLLSATYWLQTVQPSNGSSAPGTAAAFAELIAGQYSSTLPTLSSGQQSALQVNNNGILLTADEPDYTPATQAITAQDIASTSTAEYNQTWYSGAPTTGSAASFVLSSEETALIEITGTWTGTLQVEVSVDGGTNWIAHAIHLLGSTIFTSSFTGNVMGSVNVAAKTNIRVRATTAWTGTATVRVNESLNSSSVYVANAIKLVDGSSATSNTLINIVAASTAASATNTAVVVGFSPNSPLPTGSNAIGSVNQGTSPWITSDLADGSVTGGTAGTKSLLSGLIYESSGITLTNGQQAALQGDTAGNLKVNLITPIPAGTNAIGSVLANLQVANAPVTVSNPVPVTITSASAGTPIQNFTDLSSIAASGNATATYTIPATHSFSLERIFVSSEVRIKVIVANNGTTIFTAFSSSANPNIDITVTAPPTIVAGNAITVQVFNIDKGTSDAYVTIEGNQIS